MKLILFKTALAAMVYVLSSCGGGAATTALVTPAPVSAVNAVRAVSDLSPLGVNLPPVSDFSATPVFVDLVRQARRFGTAESPWDEAAVLGADGWPVGDFGVFLMTGQVEIAGTGGRYHVSFKGRAKVETPASPGASISNQVFDVASNTTTLDLDIDTKVSSGGNQLVMVFKNTDLGIKDLKVIRPGYDAGNPPVFTKPFIDHISRFSTLRFMDWLHTNDNNDIVKWSDRITPESVRYVSRKGLPWEFVIALANETEKDMWINIPVQADDDYVLNLVNLLKSTLKPQLNIYVEYSNELWNPSFTQMSRNMDLAAAEVKRNPQSPLAFDPLTASYSITNPAIFGFRRIAKRGREISQIFRQVYGDAAMMTTVRPILAGQVVQPYIARLGLEFVDAVYGSPSHYFYALASAPYFNMGKSQTAANLDVSMVLQSLGASISTIHDDNYFEANKALATWYGLKWMAYEGGPDTFGPGSVFAKGDANLDDRMEVLCKQYLATWYQSGGDLFMWFMAGAGHFNSEFGAWELTRDLTISDTPKIRCLDAVRKTASFGAVDRNVVPGAIKAVDYVGKSVGDTSTTLRYLHKGESVSYLIYAATAGTYNLQLLAEIGAAGNRLEIAVNRQVMSPSLELANVGGWGQPSLQTPATITLNRGFNTLRIKTVNETTGYWLHSLDIR